MGGNFKKGTADEVAIQEDHEHAQRRGADHPLRVRICRGARAEARMHERQIERADLWRTILWQRVFKLVKAEYPGIEASHQYIDNLLMQMVRDPSQFQVIVTSNLFGDIASDLGAQLAGGLGLAPSGNIHPGQVSLFEPVHGSAPNIAGKGIANPMGSILTVAMMFEYLGWQVEADAIDLARAGGVARGEDAGGIGRDAGHARSGGLDRECGGEGVTLEAAPV